MGEQQEVHHHKHLLAIRAGLLSLVADPRERRAVQLTESVGINAYQHQTIDGLTTIAQRLRIPLRATPIAILLV